MEYCTFETRSLPDQQQLELDAIHHLQMQTEAGVKVGELSNRQPSYWLLTRLL